MKVFIIFAVAIALYVFIAALVDRICSIYIDEFYSFIISLFWPLSPLIIFIRIVYGIGEKLGCLICDKLKPCKKCFFNGMYDQCKQGIPCKKWLGKE